MNIVILTGAGISAESGIKTFRDADGLWENHPVEEVASPEGFHRNPSLVYRFYNDRRKQLQEVRPNVGHRALTELIQFCDQAGHNIQLVTQNVDDLHERSGLRPERVWHMHGELMKMRCLESHSVHPSPLVLEQDNLCPCCETPSPLRPHIVWFGEVPFFLEETFNLLSECDLFLSIGTSGLVYPAAQFVSMTPDHCRRIEFNLGQTNISPAFHEHHSGSASETLPPFVDTLIENLA